MTSLINPRNLYVISCDLFPYQLPDHEDVCEEQWLMAKLVDLLKAEITEQQYVVGIVSVYCTVDPHNSKAVC